MTLERRYLLNREVQSSDAATRIVPLPRIGKLSGIGLRFEATNGATAGGERVFDAIDRVEVIANGSDVLFSLEGIELYKWTWANLRKRPPHIWTEVPGAVQDIWLPVLFGRWLGDPELYVDLSRYQTVELRVQYSPTITATAFVTGTFTITAVLYTWRPDVALPGTRGWIRTTQFRSFASAASGEDVTELPRRFPLLDLLVHVRQTATNPDARITIAEVREDDGLVIPYTGRFLDIAEENQQMLDLDPVEHGIVQAQDLDLVDVHLTRVLGVSFSPVFTQSDANGILTVNAASITADRITVSASETADAAAATHFTAFAARRAVHWIARGLGLPQAIYVPLWDRQNLDSAYPAPSKSKVTLALTQGGAGAAVRASVRELVPA